MTRFRIATYNVHKCRGMDRRLDVDRIVTVLREMAPDIVALQEVLSIPGGGPQLDQSRYIASQLGFEMRKGVNRSLNGGTYGNVLLSRYALDAGQNFDLSVKALEQRGALRVVVSVDGAERLQVFNVHLGTNFLERREQGRRLVDASIIGEKDPTLPRVILGDFNEWVPGLASRLLASHLKGVDVRTRRAKTYPGVFPMLNLDHIYFDDSLRLEHVVVHRTRTALVASDHLPLLADFSFAGATDSDRPVAYAAEPSAAYSD
jgi:endonuclease/exonuclease/phosphatase family metal-dependent hydrolase